MFIRDLSVDSSQAKHSESSSESLRSLKSNPSFGLSFQVHKYSVCVIAQASKAYVFI